MVGMSVRYSGRHVLRGMAFTVAGIAFIATQAMATDLTLKRAPVKHGLSRAALLGEPAEQAWPVDPSALANSLVASPMCGFDGPAFQDARAANVYTSGGSNFAPTFYTPANPHGAVGPNHLVFTVNGAIAWTSKTGAVQHFERLGATGTAAAPVAGGFFGSLGLSRNRYGTHARVVYDEYSGRFVVMALDLGLQGFPTSDPEPANMSAILLAVSDDADPNGTWYFHRINTNININGSDHFALSPAISVGPDAIYITADFADFATLDTQDASRLFIVKKAPFYSGQPAVVQTYDPSAEANFTNGATPIEALGWVPVQPLGAIPGTPKIYLVSTSSGYIGGDGSDLLFLIRIEDPTGAITFGQDGVESGALALTVSQSSNFTVPQKGTLTTIQTFTNTIAGYFGGIEGTAWRNDKLWVTYTTVPSDGPNTGQVTVRWVKFDTADAHYFDTLDEGEIGGEDISPAAATYAPAITANTQGDMAISFTASSSTLYPGAYYTARAAGDPAGTTAPAGTLAAGVNSYVRTIFGANFWGFGSTVAVDPVADGTFWTFNAYALANYVDGQGNWGTRWAAFNLTSIPGDLNFDGHVNKDDLALFEPCFSDAGGVPYNPSALPAGCTFTPDCDGIILPDFNRDGAVDMLDFSVWQLRNGDPS